MTSPSAALPNSRVTAPKFDLIAQRRRCAVRIDILNFGWRNSGLFQRHLHGAKAAIAGFFRRGDMIGVTAKTISDDFGINLRAALFGVFQSLPARQCPRLRPSQNHRGLCHRGATRASGVSLKLVLSALQAAKPGNADGADGCFRTARHHHIGVVILNETARHRQWRASRMHMRSRPNG